MNRTIPHLLAAAMLLTGCGGGTSTASKTTQPAQPGSGQAAPPAADTTPLATLPPKPGHTDATCATVHYTVTRRGVEVDVTVADTPELIQVEADDAQSQPVGGDTAKASATYTFKGATRHHVLLIAGVKTLDHVAVLPPGSPYDGCSAYRRS